MTRRLLGATGDAHRLRATPAIDDELDAFFNREESSLGLSSNYGAMLARVEGVDPRSPEDHAEAAHRYRRIRRCLRAIADSDAGVLQAAYVLRPWPVALFDALGRLTGVVVRLACALDTWPEDRDAQEVMEMARAEWLLSSGMVRQRDAGFLRLRQEAEARFGRAVQAYATARAKRLARPGAS